ncbi:fructokinase [Lutibacter agarilyticus]|uniref:Fructokinase n=1 Tax=Lutibacter agarilyticus TaxID=1109740 RepID=A0A238WYA3_9FLAO|nr:carbohydrate kinase [Lutibacter agarilyticus]SNR51413.1 fructokinase [Lutibacter agarilyticus]
MRKIKAVCFGEILFDVFLKHKKIGGAPLNVISRLKSFGIDVLIISAVGNDNNGRELIEYFNNLDINSDSIQINENYPTGIVNVSLNEKGNASYNITHPSAWDKISLTRDDTELVRNADLLLYGSLASRDKSTKKTLLQLLEVAKYKIFDVNLRAPHYSESTLKELMAAADFIKFNDDELFKVAKSLDSKHKSLEQNIKYISKKTNTNTICVTLGSHGAVLYHKRKFYNNYGFKVDVIDTVGSGDSFLAALITKLFNKPDPQEAINFACAVGAIVAQNDGANPKISQIEIDEFLND